MYCKKCGKKIDYDAEICEECQENEELFVNANETPVQPVQQPAPTYAQPIQTVAAPQDKGSRKYGLGLSIAGTIISEFAILFAYLTLILGGVTGGLLALVLFPFSFGMSIFCLIAGLKSINRYKACNKAGKVKPIPTLIMGIISLVGAITAFIMIFASVMAFASALLG